jgi:hypothetical protein
LSSNREITTGLVNVFRHAFADQANGGTWSYDFWIDARRKRLVALRIPGADIYDPEADPLRVNPVERDWSYVSIAGGVKDRIDFDAELEDALFRMECPDGFNLERRAPPPAVSEREMVEYLGALAEFNSGRFPDQLSPVPFTSDRLNRVWVKPPEQRTVGEQKLLDLDRRYLRLGRSMPIVHFLHERTEPGSFQYLGNGVSLGNRSRLVCWYRLKGASAYRAVNADLSVNDVRAEDLPLPVET